MSEILINSPAVRKKLYKTIILNSKLCKTIILNSQKISELPKEPTKTQGTSQGTYKNYQELFVFTLYTRSEYFSRAMKHFFRFLTRCQFRFPGVSQYRFPMFPKFPILLQKPIELLGVICFTLYTRSKYFFPGYETFLQVSNWMPISISRGILVQVSNVSKVSNTPTKTYRTIRSYLFYPVYPVEVFFPGL